MAEGCRRLSSLREIADRFDVCILDVWGTVYDGGIAAFPGVVTLLARLRAMGKAVVFLSNAPQRSAVVAARLERIGIGPELHAAIVTSGGETRRALAAGVAPAMAPFTGPVYQIGPDRFPGILPHGRFRTVTTIAEANWILNAGPNHAADSLDGHDPVLRQAAAAGLPMLCANPDRMVLQGAMPQICAGALAERYRALGGSVHAVGKPHRAVYDRCRALFPDFDATRFLMVGDNLETDIRGADNAGIASVLIASGVHALVDDRGGVDAVRLAVCEAAAGVAATYCMARLTW